MAMTYSDIMAYAPWMYIRPHIVWHGLMAIVVFVMVALSDAIEMVEEKGAVRVLYTFMGMRWPLTVLSKDWIDLDAPQDAFWKLWLLPVIEWPEKQEDKISIGHKAGALVGMWVQQHVDIYPDIAMKRKRTISKKMGETWLGGNAHENFHGIYFQLDLKASARYERTLGKLGIIQFDHKPTVFKMEDGSYYIHKCWLPEEFHEDPKEYWVIADYRCRYVYYRAEVTDTCFNLPPKTGRAWAFGSNTWQPYRNPPDMGPNPGLKEGLLPDTPLGCAVDRGMISCKVIMCNPHGTYIVKKNTTETMIEHVPDLCIRKIDGEHELQELEAMNDHIVEWASHQMGGGALFGDVKAPLANSLTLVQDSLSRNAEKPRTSEKAGEESAKMYEAQPEGQEGQLASPGNPTGLTISLKNEYSTAVTLNSPVNTPTMAPTSFIDPQLVQTLTNTTDSESSDIAAPGLSDIKTSFRETIRNLKGAMSSNKPKKGRGGNEEDKIESAVIIWTNYKDYRKYRSVGDFKALTAIIKKHKHTWGLMYGREGTFQLHSPIDEEYLMQIQTEMRSAIPDIELSLQIPRKVQKPVIGRPSTRETMYSSASTNRSSSAASSRHYNLALPNGPQAVPRNTISQLSLSNIASNWKVNKSGRKPVPGVHCDRFMDGLLHTNDVITTMQHKLLKSTARLGQSVKVYNDHHKNHTEDGWVNARISFIHDKDTLTVKFDDGKEETLNFMDPRLNMNIHTAQADEDKEAISDDLRSGDVIG